MEMNFCDERTCKLTLVSVNFSVNSSNLASFSLQDFMSVDNSSTSSRNISISLWRSALFFSSDESLTLKLKDKRMLYLINGKTFIFGVYIPLQEMHIYSVI